MGHKELKIIGKLVISNRNFEKFEGMINTGRAFMFYR